MELGRSWMLGSSVNLTLGLHPVLPAEGNPFFLPGNQAITTNEANLAQEPGSWEHPEITLHANAESLLSSLFDIRIRFERDEQPLPSVGAGALLLHDANRQAVLDNLAGRLGMDLSRNDRAYALIMVRRVAGSSVHRSRERGVFGIPDRHAMVAEAFDRASSRLRPCLSPSRPTPDQTISQHYLDFSKNWGTHYVSQILTGDVIYQVLSYKLDRFAVLQQAARDNPESFSGPWAAMGFSYYTRPRNGEFGDVEERSPIGILSGDPELAASVAAGDWRDEKWAGANSVLAPMLVNKTSLLRTFSRIVPIAVELSSLSLFLEYYRKITWRRICLAALYRKCGGSIQVGFGLVSDPIVSQMYSGEGGLLSLIASPVIKLFRRRFAPAEMNLVASERIRETSIVCNLLEVSSDCSLPGETVTLLAQMVLAGSAGPDLPKLTLSDAAYAADKLWFGQFQGALRLVAATSQDWTLIVDGVRFDTCPDEETGQMRVVATRDLCAPPTADILPIPETAS
uniref:hypothetical protein n=1 Tax=Chromobacterium subtsugae TaxID=251747 RepID=UPI000A4BFFEC